MARNRNAVANTPPPPDPLPPLAVPLEEFALDDEALQRRALARLAQTMETPTLMVRCGKWIDDPRLVRLRLEACRSILGLGPDPRAGDEEIEVTERHADGPAASEEASGGAGANGARRIG